MRRSVFGLVIQLVAFCHFSSVSGDRISLAILHCFWRHCSPNNIKCDQLRRAQSAQDRFKDQVFFESLLRWPPSEHSRRRCTNWVQDLYRHSPTKVGVPLNDWGECPPTPSSK